MRIIRKIKKNIRQYGVVATIQKVIQKAIGIRDVKEEIAALQFFLNAFHDASCMPPATDPDLRIMQLCDVQFLRIITKTCDRLGIKYWLDYGTLLGAIRHKGFIPWDDDMDMTMPREDYNRAMTDLREALSSYGIKCIEIIRLGHIRFGYQSNKTGIWLDVLPMDDYHTNLNREEVITSLHKVLPKYRKIYNRHIKKATIEKRTEWRQKIIGGESGNNHFLYMTPEFPYPRIVVHHFDEAMPLSKIEFEGYRFNAPHDCVQYIKAIYGNNYMGFPRKGVLHHDMGKGTLSTWAKRNDIDMNLVYEKLKDIADSI